MVLRLSIVTLAALLLITELASFSQAASADDTISQVAEDR